MQLIRPLEPYIPLAEIFERGNFYEKEDIAFLDSSLENELGRYSILGLKPYLKLVKGETFTVNGVENKTGFEAYVRNYLKEHRRENQFPWVSVLSGSQLCEIKLQRQCLGSCLVSDYKERKKVVIPDPHTI